MTYKLCVKIKGCKTLDDVRNFIKLNKIKIIFFAETHGILDELKIQDKIIFKLRPVCYLYELLEEERLISKGDFIEFLKRDDSERFSVISSFGELKPTIRLAKKYNLPLIGCDVKNMYRKNKDFLKEINADEENRSMFNRERKQIEIIKKSLIEYDGLIFVSVGAFHLRKDSPIFKEIKSNYIIVLPLIDNTELENLEKDFNISHAEKIIYIMKSK